MNFISLTVIIIIASRVASLVIDYIVGVRAGESLELSLIAGTVAQFLNEGERPLPGRRVISPDSRDSATAVTYRRSSFNVKERPSESEHDIK